ncbi:MAG: hypothetical protein ACR2KJ_13950 [Jatrophihabitans sp.]
MTPTTGPWRLVHQLTAWAIAHEWCDWLELGGSLGRGAGDELSDIDAGVGITGESFDDSVSATLRAATGFAPVADSLVQSFGSTSKHLVLQYIDGRQLSLVVSPAEQRPGLPPGSIALLDRTGRLAGPWQPGAFTASDDDLREWSFLGWWAIGDALKHASRNRPWRALAALDEARTMVWKLHAAALGIDYPGFGAVSVENADAQAPTGLAPTLPRGIATRDIYAATAAMAAALAPLTAGRGVPGLQEHMSNRLTAATTRRPRRSG